MRRHLLPILLSCTLGLVCVTARPADAADGADWEDPYLAYQITGWAGGLTPHAVLATGLVSNGIEMALEPSNFGKSAMALFLLPALTIPYPALVIGPAFVAGTSLSARKLLREEGATVASQAGWVGIALGTAFLTSSLTHILLSNDTVHWNSPEWFVWLGANLGLLAGSYVAGIAQWRANNQARDVLLGSSSSSAILEIPVLAWSGRF
jgi:hypothetical protein